MRPDLERVSDDIAQRLRDLPSELAPPFDWTEFRRRGRERAWPRRNAVKWQHAAAAAGVTVFIAGMAMWGRTAQHPTDVSSSAITMSPRVESHEPAEPAHQKAVDTRIVAAQIQAAALAAAQAALASRRTAAAQAEASQEWLARQPSEPAVVRVGPRLAVASLEDRIAWFDDALTDERFGGVDATHVDSTRLATLQQERARLVNSLAQVRYAETLTAYVQ
jgi:hypothetical protein